MVSFGTETTTSGLMPPPPYTCRPLSVSLISQIFSTPPASASILSDTLGYALNDSPAGLAAWLSGRSAEAVPASLIARLGKIALAGPEAGGKDLAAKINSFKVMINNAKKAYPNAGVFATTLREVISTNSHLWGAIMAEGRDWHVVEPREIGRNRPAGNLQFPAADAH